MNKYEAILFDLDGTLLDTCEGVLASVQDTINHFGFKELSYNELMTFNGPPMKQSLTKWFNLDNDTADKATEYFREQYKSVNLFKAKIYPNVEDTLKALKNAGLKLGVATYKRTDYAISILEHFGVAEYFDLIMGDTVGSKRTKADIIKLVSDSLSKKSLMIGDMESDYKASIQSNIDFVGLTYGYGFKKGETRDLPLLNSMEEIKQYILGL